MAGTFASSRPDGQAAASPTEAHTITGVEGVEKAVTEAIVLPTDSLIIRALQDAEKFHRGKNRTWKPVPEINHVMRVTARVMLFPDVTVPEITGTAWHDVAENCCRDRQAQESIYKLHEDRYGRESVLVMRGLTNPSVFSKASRAERKKMDFAHLGRQPVKIKRIKAVDRIDNLTETLLDLMSGVGASPRFAVLYADESEALAEALKGIDPDLITEMRTLIREIKRVVSTIMY
jgi:hypothetical protein